MRYSIYLIICTETKRVYVGRTAYRGRPNAHLQALRHKRHKIKLMQSDFDEYGEDSFSFTFIQDANLFVRDVFSWGTYEDRLKCGKPNLTEMELKQTEREWMIRLKSYDPNYGYNYLDPYFVNGPKQIRRKREIVSAKYNFPIELL